MRQEEKVGQRTILDVLNSEQQYLNAQVNLVSFQRDLVVASYGVLAAMGRLTAYDIALQAELYDPARYYGEVKDAWFGWGAALLYQATGNANYQRIASAIADHLAETQREEGPWGDPAIGEEYAHVIVDSTAELAILLCEMVEGLWTGE